MVRRYNRQAKKNKQVDQDAQGTITALYLRVSTEKQAIEGYGLEAQQSELIAYCSAQGWTVDENHIYVDAGISGKTDDRPAFQSMLEAAKGKQIGRIVATKLDRVARNLRNLLQTVDMLKRYECALVIKKEAFDTSTPQGIFVMQMLGAVGELERSMIGERVQSGRVAKAVEGGYLGSRCPLGYEYVNEKFVITDRADLVREIFKMGLSGLSLNAIVRYLNDTATPTPSGKGSWTVGGIKHILANGAYAGIAQWDGVEAVGFYPPIIEQATYDAMQLRLSRMTRGQRADLTY